MFWLVGALLGGIGDNSVETVLIWVGCFFVSVLVHEFGHGLTARAFGSSAEIVLYWMGGLCRNDAGVRHSPLQRFLVVLMGPGAGFLLAGLSFLTAYLAFGLTPVEMLDVAGFEFFLEKLGLERSSRFSIGMKLADGSIRLALILEFLVRMNIWWGLLNLLPIWPLDGGQIAGVILGQVSPAHGRRWTHVIGLVSAGILAFVSFQYTGSLFMPIFFGMFAMSNYQILQALHQQSRYGGGRLRSAEF
jgi:membrane-associated protease RseP (regulator of RpoE activity)